MTRLVDCQATRPHPTASKDDVPKPSLDPNKPLEGPSRVVLTHWAAARVRADNRRHFMQQLMLLALLYDEVLLQDEFLVLDDRVAWWLRDRNFRDLDNLAETGAVKILRHPLFAYPTEELRSLAEEAPMVARSRQIRAFATKGGYEFQPNAVQRQFYAQLDGLMAGGHVSRAVNATPDFPIMPAFERILRVMLSDQRRWSSRAYRIPSAAFDEMLRLIDNPNAARRILRESGLPATAIVEGDQPEINRSFTSQLARLFPPRVERGMRSLIQSAFAAPFTWRERAIGTYGRGLRELIVAEPGATYPEPLREVVTVESQITLDGVLPIPLTDFGAAIAGVRASPAGIRLRDAMTRLGAEPDLREQRMAWLEVADELAARLHATHPVRLRTALAEGASGVVGAMLVEGIVKRTTTSGLLESLPLHVLAEGGAGIAAVGGPLLCDLARQYLPSVETRMRLERAVTFRCSPVPVPPFLVDVIPAGYGGGAT